MSVSADTNGDKDVAKIKVADLGLTPRVTSSLEDAGIKTAAGLARKSIDSLKELDGIGDKAIAEIESALGKLGLSLKGE
jgi:DNA-directed RNA polymerase alpha subunit